VPGTIQRHPERPRDSDVTLARSVRHFQAVGTPLRGANTRGELGRLGLRLDPTEQLTPSEGQLAVLAGSGLATRESAAKLSVSRRTVEAQLVRVYRKLPASDRDQISPPGGTGERQFRTAP
jgi:DNA-binding CsgD family transcriptional regulator